MTLWRGDPSVRETELHHTLADLSSPDDLIAVCSTEFLPAWEWGTHQQVSKNLRMTVGLNWAWCRHQPRNVFVQNNRCAACGWLTRRICVDEEQCYVCHNVGVCTQCTYLVPNRLVPPRDRVNPNSAMRRRCLQCDLLPGVATITPHQRNLCGFIDGLYDKYDASYRYGAYSHPEGSRQLTSDRDLRCFLVSYNGGWSTSRSTLTMAGRRG